MPLLGRAAMLLTFDIVDAAIAEHDDWHTHEHLPERLSIPGFLRGTRWVAATGAPRYMVLYEVDDLDTLESAPYLERLDNPTPWTRKMMPHYRGMARGLCGVVKSVGFGMGGLAHLLRFRQGGDARVETWLAEAMPRFASQPGIGSLHLLRGARAAAMTSEQRIRGADAGVDWALLATGYGERAIATLAQTELAVAALEKHGATEVTSATYQVAYSLAASEIAPGRR